MVLFLKENSHRFELFRAFKNDQEEGIFLTVDSMTCMQMVMLRKHCSPSIKRPYISLLKLYNLEDHLYGRVEGRGDLTTELMRTSH